MINVRPMEVSDVLEEGYGLFIKSGDGYTLTPDIVQLDLNPVSI